MSKELNLTPRRLEYLRHAAEIYRAEGSNDWYLASFGRAWKVTADVNKMRDAGWVTDGRRTRQDMRWALCLRRTRQGNALLASHVDIEQATPTGDVL